MLKYFKLFVKNIKLFVLSLLVGFSCFFLGGDIINNFRAEYEASFTLESGSTIDENKLVSNIYLIEIRDSNSKYSNIDVNAMLASDDFTLIHNDKYTIVTKYRYYDSFFLGSTNSVSTRAKTFIKDAVNGVVNGNVIFEDNTNIVTRTKYLNRWIVGIYGIVFAFIVYLVVFTIMCKKHIEKLDVKKENNHESLKSYVKEATKPIKNVKDMTILAMFFAIMMVCKLIPIPSGFGNLGLSLTYLFFAMACMVYGPLYGFIIGIFSDIIGYIMPNGGGGMFNFGYTLQAALTGFIYGICFYRTKLTFGKTLLSRVLVNFLMNAVYGSFLFIFVTYFSSGDFVFAEYLSKVKYYMLLLSLPKNIVYLIPQSILLYYVLKITKPILANKKVLKCDII